MASKMLSKLIVRSPALRYKFTHVIWRRNLLSQGHCCEEVWKERLNSALLKKVDVGNFALSVRDKLDKEGLQAIDMDILANKLEQLEKQQWNFVQNLFYRFRHTNETLKASESMSHAVIRALVQHEEYKRLFEILPDKINYGIFLDDFSALFLLNHFHEKEMYAEGAQVAYELMLQEDFSHPLVKYLSWLACVKHLKINNSSVNVEEKAEEEGGEEEEEQWIPVSYIRNPWYDDHWDIDRESLLLGKTLNMIASQDEGVLRFSYKLIGLGLHEKFQNGIDLMNDILKSDDQQVLAEEAIESYLSVLENVVTKEHDTEEKEPGTLTMDDVRPYITQEQKTSFVGQTKDIISQLKSKNKVIKVTLEEKLVEKVENFSGIFRDKDISKQTELFKSWENERISEVQRQIDDIRKEELKTEIAKKLIDMQKKEERLSYFEDLEKIMLGISRAPKFRPIEDVVEEEQFVLPPTERGKAV